MQTVNIYCDESCHLENDRQQVMLLGAICCPCDQSRMISQQIKKIKKKHRLSPSFEIKWTKVSPAKIDFYLDLLHYFFTEENLVFRTVIIPDKSQLRHKIFDQDHDTWYYKMYFEMLKVLFGPYAHYRIYLDIKDSSSGEKVKMLHNILCNNIHDFKHQIIERVQTVRSHEIAPLQLADLLMGCVLAANRKEEMSEAKKELMKALQLLSGSCLTQTTPIREKKMNVLLWQASESSKG